MEVDDTQGSHRTDFFILCKLARLTQLLDQEQQTYLDTTKDRGNQKLNFRFSY